MAPNLGPSVTAVTALALGLLGRRRRSLQSDGAGPTIGERAAAWLRKYIAEARPQLAIEPDDMSVFLTAQGEPFSRDHLTAVVKDRVDAAKLGKTGSCHLFRSRGDCSRDHGPRRRKTDRQHLGLWPESCCGNGSSCRRAGA